MSRSLVARDYVAMGLLGASTFLLSLGVPKWYWKPTGNMCWAIAGVTHCGIFDEIYFGRAAEEYLRNLRIYENTHPPLAKLLITLSTLLFGGVPSGDNPAGWRFLDVVFGALVVMLLYVFAKRVTGSTVWAAVAAGFLTFDGMHYVQSRIATPEGFVVFFALAAVYAFYRFWIASQSGEPRHAAVPPAMRVAGVVAAIAAGILAMLLFDLAQHLIFGWPWFALWTSVSNGRTQGPGALVVSSVYFACGFYLIVRNVVFPKFFGDDGLAAKLWLLLFTLALGALVSSKWYGVMLFGVSFLLLTLVWANRRGFRLDGALVTVVFVSMTVYGLVWIPDLVRQASDPGEIHNVNDVVQRQYAMYDYHAHLRATHPYSSKWFEWPFDYVPVAYYYQDLRGRTQSQADDACCVYEVNSMPNPITLWFGLICVPIVGVLAWRERNKAYALLVVTYLFQWLPWAKSPRLAWEYHFYVNVPLICLCNAIVLQRLWQWAGAQRAPTALAARGAVVGMACLVVAAFVFFFPILSAWPLSWNAWHARMWLPTWVIGPG